MSNAAPPRGSRLGYKALGLFFKVFGYGFVAFFARIIVVYYFLFYRRVVNDSIDFYAALYPDKDKGFWKKTAWNQFKSFTTVFLDRFLIENGRHDAFTLTHDGLQHITERAESKRPAILWMAHLGNWEVAVHCLKRYQVPITLVVGKYAGEQIEALQRAMLKAGQVKVVTVQEDRDMGVMEVMQALKAGELVAISGDRLFDNDQRFTHVNFLGRKCRVPKGPYVLSGLTKAPLIPIFGLRESKLSYRFVALDPISVDFSLRKKREEAIERAAQDCFEKLENMVSTYPTQWYNFFKYWD